MKKTFIMTLCAVLALSLVTGCSSSPSGPDQPSGDQAKKADPARGWIYDAEYEAGFDADSFTARDGTHIDAHKDLIVPFINIDSADAARANDEIKSIYFDLADAFNYDCQEKIWWEKSSYTAYQYENTVSAMLKLTYGGTAEEDASHYGYCFDVKDGHRLSFAEAIRLLNYSEGDVIAKLSDAAAGKLKSFVDPSAYDADYRDTVDQLKRDVAGGSLQYVITSSGELGVVIVLLALDMETGYFPSYVVIK